MIPEAEKGSVDNELGKEELLIKDAETCFLLLYIEWGPILAGGTLRNCVSEPFFWEIMRLLRNVFAQKPLPIIPLSWGLSLEDVNFAVFYVRSAHWVVFWFLSHMRLKWSAGSMQWTVYGQCSEIWWAKGMLYVVDH